MTEKTISGIISESYNFAMDGEFCSGYKEYDVKVTQYWKGVGEYQNMAKEVMYRNTCFRHSKMNGWRYYDKDSKRFIEKRGIGLSLTFIPNEISNHNSEYNRVNLGDW